MRIVVTSTGPDLDAAVDPRFGRCQHFVFVETDDMGVEAMENPNIALGGGAGIQSAQLIADKGAAVVLTGNCGPNAYQTLAAAGVQVIVGVSGSVREAVERYKTGALSATTQANVQSHFGMGMSGGMGRGMGRGMGMGAGMVPGASMTSPPQMTKEQELEMLKQQADALQQQIEEINGRIREIHR